MNVISLLMKQVVTGHIQIMAGHGFQIMIGDGHLSIMVVGIRNQA